MPITEKNIMSRLYLIAGLLILLMGMVVFRLVSIAAVEGGELKLLALQKTERVNSIPPIRGNIFSDDGSLLASSIPKYTIHFDPVTPSTTVWENELTGLCDSLGVMFNKPASFYKQKFRKARNAGKRYVLVAKNLDYPDFARLKTFPMFKRSQVTGGMISDYKVVREYPLGEIAWRSIGYEKLTESGDSIRVGLDGAFGKDFLSGVVGQRWERKSGGGNVWKPVSVNNIIEPKDGMDIVSTINTNIQDIAHFELKKQLEAYNADHGCVVVMEVKTGAVKAIANLGRNAKGDYVELRNYAVWESHEPGSTFKMASLLSALEDNLVDTTTVFDTHKGRWKVYNKRVKDSRWGGYGEISVAEGFTVSSNTVFAQIIHENYKENPQKFVNHLMRWGLHKKLKLPIIGEGKPVIRQPGEKGWSGLSLAWMSHGYEVALTPLQTLTFYNAIANDGEMVKPRFIETARIGNKVEKEFEKEVLIDRIASKENIGVAQDLLKYVITKKNGTGHALYDPNFSMAGKTGTCWKNYWANAEERDYISSFVGYFPAENPQYSCIVVIHEPNQEKGKYGAEVAGPVFKSMAQKIYRSSPTIDEVEVAHQKDEKLDHTYESYFVEMRKNHNTVPNLKGMSGMDAISILENLGLKVEVKGNGKVVEQSVNSGTALKDVDKIVLKLS